MMLFHIRNTIVNLFKNRFRKEESSESGVRDSDIGAPKFDLKSEKSAEQSTGGWTKLRRQRLNEIAKKEKTIDYNLFTCYFKNLRPSDMYKELNKVDTEKNKVKVDFYQK